MTRRQLTELGRSVRLRVAKWVHNNPDVAPDNLCGACAIASYTLWQILLARGVKARFVICTKDWENHCWVETRTHIIDITATQFGGPQVAVFPKKERSTEWYDYQGCARDSKGVRHLKEWVGGQKPNRYRSKIARLVGELGDRSGVSAEVG